MVTRLVVGGRRREGGWSTTHLLGQLSSGKLSCTILSSTKGVCTALPSTGLVPVGQDSLEGSLQASTPQCRIRPLGLLLTTSTWMHSVAFEGYEDIQNRRISK